MFRLRHGEAARARPGVRDPARRPRPGQGRAGALVLALLAAGCVGDGGVGINPLPQEPVGPEAGAIETIGSGATPVALLLPKGAGGSASGLAEAFRNAAELALADSQRQDIRILVADTGGTDTGGTEAATATLAEGARLVLGPVFAPAVRGASGPARAAGVPVIAFSTDATVAGNGVWLLSFQPRQDVERIVSFAAGRGLDDVAALLPDDAYGVVAEAAFRSAAAAEGVSVAGVERYAGADDLAAKARAIAGSGRRLDAVFVPNGGNDPGIAAEALAGAGANVPLLGSGQWDSPAVLERAALVGSWFPGPAPGGFARFAEAYRARYGTDPPRTASLVYDAVLLANGLVAARGPAAAFAPGEIANREGFLGVDGIFRFTRNGLSERGLAVFRVAPGGRAEVVVPAPDRFGASNF